MTNQSAIRILSASAPSIAVLTVICLLFTVGTPAQEKGMAGTYHDRWFTFTTFDVPMAGKGAYEGTVPISINSVGEIAGMYIVAGNVTYGFVRAANGKITAPIKAPGAGSGNNQGTFPISINTAGDIAGYYADANNMYHGFVRTANGTISSIDVPGESMDGHAGTMAMSINAAGEVAGMYRDVNLVYHGFVRDPTTGNISTFSAPGAGTDTYQGTMAMSINTAGEVAGGYSDANYLYHGFVRDPTTGNITTFVAPGAGTGNGSYKGFGTGTEPLSIDDAGVIAGNYTDAKGVRHGFVRAATNGNKITSFDAPGTGTLAGMFQGTSGLNINAAGSITGVYGDANSVIHGFVRAANGAITTINVRGAGTLSYEGTMPISTNAAGDITGAYLDANGVVHGFVAKVWGH